MKNFSITFINWKKKKKKNHEHGETNKSTLREDETLAEVVKKYQRLYDKSFAGYGAISTCQFEVFCIHFVKEMN